MPRPNRGEKRADFVSRYMGDAEARKKYPDQAQRSAVAYSAYQEAKKKVEKQAYPVITLAGEILIE